MNAVNHRQVPAAITQLRAEIEALPQRRDGKRHGISDELKRRVAQELGRSGMRTGEFSSAVSVSVSALCKWQKQFGIARPVRGGRRKKEAMKSPGFKKMQVTEDKTEGSGRFTLEGPMGLRVSGLGMEEVARLWRALC